MNKYFNLKLLLLLVLCLSAAGITYLNLDSMAKSCYIMFEKVLNRQETLTQQEPELETEQINPPAQRTQTTDYNFGSAQRKIASRDGTKYLVRGAILQEYTGVGGEKSILGLPRGNEYKWKGGIRQDFERGQWLFWSSETGVKLNYDPPGFITDHLSELQVPVFVNGKPAVEWSRLSKDNYFITQEFGENGHLGQDLGYTGNPDPGYDVQPIAEGKVVFAGWTGSNSYGYCVLVRHSLGNGRYFYSQYSHLYETPNVYPGEHVGKNTVLGRIGNTGKSTGPHLDFQIKEIPRVDKKNGNNVTLSDLGHGYTPGHREFEGNIYYDPRTGQTYYKPSYIIENYKNNPGAVMNEFRRIFDLNLPFKNFPSIIRTSPENNPENQARQSGVYSGSFPQTSQLFQDQTGFPRPFSIR